MDLNFEFKTKEQEKFFYSKARNNCFSGGFGNGKSWIGCARQFMMLASYPNYRSLIGREKFTDLRETTMRTFFKICPEEFVEAHNIEKGITTLKNGSMILWKHLDAFNEQSLRGLEINSALLDQAEETREATFYVLDSRIGRWDQAQVPDYIKEQSGLGNDWPKEERGNDKVPNFFDILCNPDTKFHWIYKKFHPESPMRDPDYGWIHAKTVAALNDPKTIENMLKRDPEWVAKYFEGQWGASSAQLHYMDNSSIIDLPAEEMYDFMKMVLREGILYRSFDHGEASPSCCLWVAHFRGVYIFYREYYAPNTLIGDHRRNISDLSRDENYAGNYADPSIFKKSTQKNGAFWTVADEYLTLDIKASPIYWEAADNNEYATRNRINELLNKSDEFTHPVTGERHAPGLYFIKKRSDHNFGCYNAIDQLLAQRREELGSDNGRIIYADDRDTKITDHAYDPIRYFVAMHSRGLKNKRREIPQRSLMAFDRFEKMRNVMRPLSKGSMPAKRDWVS